MNTITHILSIGLPLLIIIMGLFRSKTSGLSGRNRVFNTLTLLSAILLLLVGIERFLFPVGQGAGAGNDREKPNPIAVSKHGETFNQSIAAVLDNYYQMTEAFVNWDTAVVNHSAANLIASLDSIRTDQLKQDTAKYAEKILLTAIDFISNAKSETSRLLLATEIGAKRVALNELTDNLRNLLITVKFDLNKVYYQECPMAFDDDIPGYWLSPTVSVRNPYLGNKHPKFQATMVNFGKPRDTIDFLPGSIKK